VPLLCLLVLVQWVGRALGLMRVGVYLQGLEDALRAAYPSAPPTVFGWEKLLADARPEGWWKPSYEWHDFGAIAVFVLLAAGSIGLGGYRGYARHEATVTAFVVAESIFLALFAIALIVEMAYVRRNVRRTRQVSSTA